MTETPEQTATRLLGHAGEFSMFTTAQVKALLIKAIEEERARKK